MRKNSPDFQLCQRKVERTPSYRPQRRYNLEVSVSEILEEFPTLWCRNFLSIETKSENDGIPDETWDKLHTSLIHLIKFTKQPCKNFQFYSRYMKNLDSTLNEEGKKEHRLLFAVQMIPSLFREDEEMVIVDSIESPDDQVSISQIGDTKGLPSFHQWGTHLDHKDSKIQCKV
ncbi:uncharacterized protein LOC135093291 isoform X2 [Scylla paramamosain]